MIELVLSVCLIEQPSHCKDVNVIFHDITASQCMMASPTEVARYLESHPKWVAKRWTCRAPGTLSKV